MSSNTFYSGPAKPVTILQYRDIATSGWIAQDAPSERGSDESTAQARLDTQISEAEIATRVRRERDQAVHETEQRLRREYEAKLALANSSMADALNKFSEQRSDYFAHVEAEVVQLALSIAAKILHREVQVDPMLVAALVRIAIEKMSEGSEVKIRVNPSRAANWRSYFAGISNLSHVEVLSDDGVSEFDCLVETGLGAANFGLDSQLKEIEHGFFDLLALRPAK